MCALLAVEFQLGLKGLVHFWFGCVDNTANCWRLLLQPLVATFFCPLQIAFPRVFTRGSSSLPSWCSVPSNIVFLHPRPACPAHPMALPSSLLSPASGFLAAGHIAHLAVAPCPPLSSTGSSSHKPPHSPRAAHRPPPPSPNLDRSSQSSSISSPQTGSVVVPRCLIRRPTHHHCWSGCLPRLPPPSKAAERRIVSNGGRRRHSGVARKKTTRHLCATRRVTEFPKHITIHKELLFVSV